MEVLELPLGGGHGTGSLVRQVDAGLLRESYRGSISGDGVDAELFSQRVVVGVAGPRNRVVDIDHAMMFVAGEEVPVERGATVAHHAHGLGDVLFEPRKRHDDLEGGTR